MQRRVGVCAFLAVVIVVGTVEVVYNLVDCVERTAQVKQFAFVKMRAFKAQAGYGLAHVEEVVHGKVVGFLLQTPELAHLSEPFVYHVRLAAWLYGVNHLFAQCA